MDYSKINIPYIKDTIIELKAKRFREKYWDNRLPINIEKIIEISLRIYLVPTADLEKKVQYKYIHYC
ncbi:MAG: hypothetical protein KAS12_05050 [Candidatus Aenigmarchaeota archaeon]|nr:hypothetical protein [Candidatus Aenigmarchaeota archaeon]